MLQPLDRRDQRPKTPDAARALHIVPPAVEPFDGPPTVAQMDVIIARYGVGQSIAAIAAHLGLTDRTVRRSLRRSDILREEDRVPEGSTAATSQLGPPQAGS